MSNIETPNEILRKKMELQVELVALLNRFTKETGVKIDNLALKSIGATDDKPATYDVIVGISI